MLQKRNRPNEDYSTHEREISKMMCEGNGRGFWGEKKKKIGEVFVGVRDREKIVKIEIA